MNRLEFLLDKAKKNFFKKEWDDSITFNDLEEMWKEEGCKTDWLDEPEITEFKFLTIIESYV